MRRVIAVLSRFRSFRIVVEHSISGEKIAFSKIFDTAVDALTLEQVNRIFYGPSSTLLTERCG